MNNIFGQNSAANLGICLDEYFSNTVRGEHDINEAVDTPIGVIVRDLEASPRCEHTVCHLRVQALVEEHVRRDKHVE